MREPILKAVANPPKIFWGPVLPVMMNLGIQFPIMFMFMGTFDVNPLWFIVSIVLMHIVIVALGARDPHMSAMIQAFGDSRHKSTNVYKEKGDKFVP